MASLASYLYSSLSQSASKGMIFLVSVLWEMLHIPELSLTYTSLICERLLFYPASQTFLDTKPVCSNSMEQALGLCSLGLDMGLLLHTIFTSLQPGLPPQGGTPSLPFLHPRGQVKTAALCLLTYAQWLAKFCWFSIVFSSPLLPPWPGHQISDMSLNNILLWGLLSPAHLACPCPLPNTVSMQ